MSTMPRLLAAALLALTGCAVDDEPWAVDEAAIFGGEATEVGDVPALALIVVADAQLCTGALISPTAVLTAAHCVDNPAAGLSPSAELAANTTIAFDRLSHGSTDGIELRGRRIAVHPDWDDVILHGNDLAVIELERALDDRTPMPLNVEPALPAAGSTITFVGFGRSDPLDTRSFGTAYTLAARAVVPCASLGDGMPLGDDQMLCFDQRDGKGICTGDSGGPVIADVDGVPTLVGVNSLVFDPAGVSCNAFAASTRSDAHADAIAAMLEPPAEDSGGCAVGGAASPYLVLLALIGLGRGRRARRRAMLGACTASASRSSC